MFVITTDTYPGYWGSGDTEAEAKRNAKYGSAPWILYEIDPWWDEAWVDGLGGLRVRCSEAKAATPHAERPAAVRSVTRIGARGKRTPLDPRTGEPL